MDEGMEEGGVERGEEIDSGDRLEPGPETVGVSARNKNNRRVDAVRCVSRAHARPSKASR